MTLPTLLTESEAASRLGMSLSTLRNERRAGRIGYTRIASMVRYTERDLLDYINRNTTPPCPDGAPPSIAAAPTSSISGRTRRTGVSVTSIDEQDRPSAKALVRKMSRKRSD